MIYEILKKILPSKIKSYVRMGEERRFFSEVIRDIEQSKEEYDMLIGTPLHKNLGDHLITLAEIDFIKELQPGRKLYEIPSEVFQFYCKRLKKTIQPTTRVFINGGGWMGNLWPNEEKLLQNIVNAFHHNKIVIFPQTIFYDMNVPFYHSLLDRGNKIYKKCNEIVLFVRDHQSFLFAKKNLNIKKILLVPDIALSYKFNNQKNIQNKIIGLCVRDDREQFVDQDKIQFLCDALSKKGFLIKKFSTITKNRIPSIKRRETCESLLCDISTCDAIITDRLHGMIFSFIANTPCVVFDNLTKKVSGVYGQWLYKSKRIFPCFFDYDVNKIINFIQSNNDNKDNNDIDFESEFDLIKQEVLNEEN